MADELRPGWASAAQFVVAQTAVLGAVAYYIGQSYNDGYYGYLGSPREFFDPKLYDVLLIGGRHVFIFFGIGLLACVFLVAGSKGASAWIVAGDTRYFAASIACLVLACAGLIAGYALWSAHRAVLASALTAAAIAMSAFFAFLVSEYPHTAEPARRFWRYGIAGCAVALALISVNALAELAHQNGAKEAADSLGELPVITIYSDRNLFLAGSGVKVTPAKNPRFRYDGLRLVRYANQKYVMVGAGWKPSQTVFVLPEAADFRVDISKPEEAP
ncbi:hypothetical protein [Actinoplanes sp. NPDC048796]|uniref:hypothetical protein n=1 Tax=unclassified Actinoplanes TaxID=2626549 RepID=UPI0033F10A6B